MTIGIGNFDAQLRPDSLLAQTWLSVGHTTTPASTGAGDMTGIRLFLENPAHTFLTGFQSGPVVADITYQWPTTAPTAGQGLQSTAPVAGIATLSWAALAAVSNALLDGAAHSDTLAGAVLDGDTIIGNVTPKWSRLAIVVPAANVRNVFGVDNGETRPSWKTALASTTPTAITAGGTGGPGTSLIFSHLDHDHPAPATYPATAHNIFSTTHGDTTGAASPVDGDIVIGNVTPKWSKLAITVPAADVLNALGVVFGETRPSWKSLMDGTVATTQAFGDAAAAGTGVLLARITHKHAMPASPTNALLDGTAHTDTLAGAVLQGDILVGNATPKWARVAKGAAGSVLFGDGTDSAWTINPLIAGYARIGSAVAPTNVTAGDATLGRLAVGSDTAFGSAGNAGYFVNIAGTLTDTAAGAKSMIAATPTFAPASASSTEFRTLYFLGSTSDSGGTFNLLESIYAELRHRSTQTIAETISAVAAPVVLDSSSPAAPGAVTLATCFEPRAFSRPSGTRTVTITTGVGLYFKTGRFIQAAGATLTDLYAIKIEDINTSTITNLHGIDIARLTRGGTTNIELKNAGVYQMATIAIPAAASGLPASGYISQFGFAKATGAYQDTPRWIDSLSHDSGPVMRAHNAIPLPLAPCSTTLTSAIPSSTLGFVGMVVLKTPITVHTISYNIGTVAAGVNGVIRLAVYTESGALIINTTDSPGLVTGVQTKTLAADVYLPAGVYKTFVCMSVDETVTNPALSCFTQEATFSAVASEDILCGTVVVTGGAAPDPHGTITSVANRTPYFKFGGAAT